MGYPVLPVAGAVRPGPSGQSGWDEIHGAFRCRAAPGMPTVRHDARLCGNGPWRCACRVGMEPGRSVLVHLRVAEWRSGRGLSGMVLAEKEHALETGEPVLRSGKSAEGTEKIII